MRTLLPILALILFIPFTSCSGSGYWDSYPTYPTGGEYDYGGDGYYSPYDDMYDWPDYAREVEGTWEGFMWEDYRSDGRPLGKKMVAVRITYADWEYVKVNVLVDGRPVANQKTRVTSSGRISFYSSMCSMSGYFHGSSASGSMTLDWDEKVKNPYNGEMEKRWVHLGGEFSLNRSRWGQWDAAWALFDTYDDVEIWNLADDVWEEAASEGLAHLAELESTFVRVPVE